MVNYSVSDLSQEPIVIAICISPIEVFVSNVLLTYRLITNKRFDEGSFRVHTDSPEIRVTLIKAGVVNWLVRYTR